MTPKDMFFTPEFKADALDRIANWKSRQQEKPAWTGLFWPDTIKNDQNMPVPYHNGRATLSFEGVLRRKDFEAAISRFPQSSSAISRFQDALSEAGLVFAEDDLSLLEGSVDGQINRYQFHKEMLKLIAEPEDVVLSRIAFVSERLHLASTTPLPGLLFQAANRTFFRVVTNEPGAYAFKPLDTSFPRPGDAFNRAGSREPAEPEIDDYWTRREDARTSEKIDFFGDRRFASLITGPVQYNRFANSPARLPVILTDMAAQGITAAQLIDRHGKSHTLVDLDQLTTLKEVRARLHEWFGWTIFTHIRELPAPQVVHRFIVVDRKIIADTPLLTTGEPGSMSEMTYLRLNGKTSTSIRSVPGQEISNGTIEWVNQVVAKLHPNQKSALIDVGLSPGGQNLVDIHDIFEEEWFAADDKRVIEQLAKSLATQFGDDGRMWRPKTPSVLQALYALDEDPTEPHS